MLGRGAMVILGVMPQHLQVPSHDVGLCWPEPWLQTSILPPGPPTSTDRTRSDRVGRRGQITNTVFRPRHIRRIYRIYGIYVNRTKPTLPWVTSL